jgi:cell wall-associated NlpC family hydrolase
VLAAAAAVLAVGLPGGVSAARTAKPRPSLDTLVARAKQLSYQISALGQQYDGLRVQLKSASAEEKKAQQASARDTAALKKARLAVARIASASFMNAGLDPTMQLLTSGNPQQALSQASIMDQLGQQNGALVNSLVKAEATATRARQTAQQQVARVTRLDAAISAKRKTIQAKIDQIHSAAMRQAFAVFQQTGQYPSIAIPGGNTAGDIALRYALSKRGDPYVWGAAGPGAFDCSGLVMWAYGQEGISLPHYTGSQWNSGEHISRSQLEPGDLVFFYADIGHVGMYIGNGLMVDAPNYAQPVQVQPVWWNVYVGAVRITR